MKKTLGLHNKWSSINSLIVGWTPNIAYMKQEEQFFFFTKYNQLMSTIKVLYRDILSPERDFDHKNFWGMIS
jgi:hypothetical protein